MAWGLSFGGTHSTTKGLKFSNIAGRGILPEIDSKTILLPSKHGLHYFGYRFQEKRITATMRLLKGSLSDFRTSARDLAAWLDPRNGPKELIFDDEPDKKYFAVVTGNTDFEGLFIKKVAEIEFLCPDPFAYSTTENSSVFSDDAATVINTGTEETFPIFTINFSASASEIKISKDADTYIRIKRNFVANDEVQINCEEGTIVLSGVTNLIPSLDIESEFFSLDPGTSNLTISPAGVAAARLVYVRRWI